MFTAVQCCLWVLLVHETAHRLEVLSRVKWSSWCDWHTHAAASPLSVRSPIYSAIRRTDYRFSHGAKSSSFRCQTRDDMLKCNAACSQCNLCANKITKTLKYMYVYLLYVHTFEIPYFLFKTPSEQLTLLWLVSCTSATNTHTLRNMDVGQTLIREPHTLWVCPTRCVGG